MMSVGNAFVALRSALESAGVRYAVGGSWASTAFGEPRFTNDADILADFTAESLSHFCPVCRNPTTPTTTKPGMPSAAEDPST